MSVEHEGDVAGITAAWASLRKRTWFVHMSGWAASIGLICGVPFLLPPSWAFVYLLSMLHSLAAVICGWSQLRLIRAGFVDDPTEPWSLAVIADGFEISAGTRSARVCWDEIEPATVCERDFSWSGSFFGLEPSASVRLRSGALLGVPSQATGYGGFVRELERRVEPGLIIVTAPFWARGD